MTTETNKLSALGEQVLSSLGPRLSQLQTEHAELREQTKTLLIWIASASVLLALVVRLALGSGWGGMAFLVLVAGGVLCGWQLMRRQKQWEQRVLGAAVPEICSALEEIEYQPTVAANEFLAPFEKLEVIGSSNHRQLNHHFRGRHQQTGFEIVEANLYRTSKGGRRSSSSSTTIFQGLLFRIQLPVTVEQRLLISPRVSIGLFNKRADMVEVPFDDPAFDEKFVVHHELDCPDGAAQAHEVLTPEFRQALLEINEREGKKAYGMGGFTLGLMYDSLYLALSRFQKSGEVGKIQIEKPVPFLDVRFFMFADPQLQTRVARMVEDVGTVYRVIDRLPL
jgi:hypothetical protein